MVKAEKPVRKRPKQDPVSSAALSKAGSSSAPAKKSSAKDQKDSSVAPSKTLVKPHGHKPVKPPLVEVTTKPHKKAVTPPPAILAEDTHVDVRGRSPTPVTVEYMLDRIFTDYPTLSALRIPHRVKCFSSFFFLPGSNPLFLSRTLQDVLCVLGTVCFASIKSLWLHALTVTVGVTAPVGCPPMTCRRSMINCYHLHRPLIHVCTFTYSFLFFSANSFLVVEMHDRNFMAADHQIRLLLNALQEVYKMRSAALCNLLQAFSSVEGSHDTDAMVKFAREYPIGHRLMIDMGLIMDEDGLLQKVFDPQFKHYYPRPLQLHSKKLPELSLPAFTVLKDKKKKKRHRRSEAPETGVEHGYEEEQADDDKVAGDLIDQLEPSPVHPSKAASSVSYFPSLSFLFLCYSCS